MKKGLAAVSVSRISREKTVSAVLMVSIVFHFVSVSIQIKMSILQNFKCAIKELAVLITVGLVELLDLNIWCFRFSSIHIPINQLS